MKKTNPKKGRYRYVVVVREVVESKTEIDSGRKKSWDQLAKEAERRRLAGKLVFSCVRDVDMWCESAKDSKKECDVRLS